MLTMLAPGVGITAAGITMSGTSQATPFVAASLAVLRNMFPSYTLAQIVAALTSTGVMVSCRMITQDHHGTRPCWCTVTHRVHAAAHAAKSV
jgi:subtilisin family serine protease